MEISSDADTTFYFPNVNWDEFHPKNVDYVARKEK